MLIIEMAKIEINIEFMLIIEMAKIEINIEFMLIIEMAKIELTGGHVGFNVLV